MRLKRLISNWRPSKQAFTLAGLAVVLACLALLGFMLLPALSIAKDKQAIQVDLENLRQLTQASQMYAADSRGFEPAPGWGITADSWLYGAYPPYGIQGSVPLAQIVYTNQIRYLRRAQLWPYIKNPRAFTCPMDSTNTALWAARNTLTTSYGMNGSVCGYGGVADGRSFQAFLFAPDRIQIWEIDETNPFYFNDASMFPYEGLSGRHRNFPQDVQTHRASAGSGVLGNFDGSAEIMSNLDFNKISGSSTPEANTGPNRLWCNPASPNGG
jgi:type II secretory pathway pseudopilin PulG